MYADAAESMALNRSFWQHKYGAYVPNGALPGGDHRTDVLIIGAGYTGLNTAREIRADDPSVSVMVIDAHEIGFGASGRNGGFSMTLFGVEPEFTALRWGKDRTRQAQAYMQQAVGYTRDLIERENLDSDYEHTGMWRLAYSEKQEKRLRKTFDLLRDITDTGRYDYLDRNHLRQKLNIPNARAAIFEPDTGILDPCKHVRSLKRLAEAAGAEIFENTPATRISRDGNGITVETGDGRITADRLILATNAWSHTFRAPKRLRNRQRPVWTYQIVTEPLTEDEWAELGWQDRMSIEDNRQLVHYLRITKCGRITIGGGRVGIEYGTGMNLWHDDSVWTDLEKHFRWMFPSLGDKPIHYKWGGPVSVNLDMTPEIGFIGDERMIFANGCIGHGVSLTHLNGRLIADLVAGRETELTAFWIVNRKAIPNPPGDLMPYVAAKALEGTLKSIDWWEERGLKQA